LLQALKLNMVMAAVVPAANTREKRVKDAII